MALWIAALGILLQAAAGTKGYHQTVPPGVIILVVTGLFVYFTSRWVWTAIVGLALACLIWVGVFVTPGTAYRLQHPQDIGPLIGTLLQLIGLAFAVAAAIATIVRSVRRKRAM